MKDSKLTVSIVTADRDSLRDCLSRLFNCHSFKKVVVNVIDNSSTEYFRNTNLTLCKTYGVNYYYKKDFIDARNYSVTICETPYFTFLDDDDYLAENAIDVMLSAIDKYKSDFISFGVEKEGRVESFNNKATTFRSRWRKYKMLNRFDNYESDRLNKIYLWNCAILFKTDIFKFFNIKWVYRLCDDILPVTSAYLHANSVTRINTPIYYYKSQQYVTSEKSDSNKFDLENNMVESYIDLKTIFHNRFDRRIINKGISNSMMQLEFNDKINSIALQMVKSM